MSSAAVRPFADTPLVAAAIHLDRPAVVCGDRDWTWRQVHAAAIVLAGRLEGVTALCNLCQSRVGFLVTWLAALRRGCVQLLPPSGGHAELASILKAGGDCLVVVDDAGTLHQPWAAHARCLVHVPVSDDVGLSDAALAWLPAWGRPLVRLYTSGSTGTPEPQVKTLQHLAAGAQVLAARLETEIDGGLSALRLIVCSVPPQHMFGLEASVMWPLVCGIPVLDSRPLLPADVRAAFESAGEGGVWVTTPLHLRALTQTGDSVAHCRAIIASTMPLSPALAAVAEGLVGAPVLEIYGSTETGAVAMRRAAREELWRPLSGVRLEPTPFGTLTWGEHFPSPQTLADNIEFDAPDGFRLLGRQSDLIKIAGRRASLAGLDQLLSDMPGVGDGVFYLPATGAPTERLVLIHAGPPLDRSSAEAWLRERMDPVFLPRAIIRVHRMPRSVTGKLPRAALDEVYDTWLASKAAR